MPMQIKSLNLKQVTNYFVASVWLRRVLEYGQKITP